MKTEIVEISKFLSYVLRHRPDEIGLTLDTEGWADLHALIAAALKGVNLDHDLIRRIVATSDKKRFALSADEMRIRAEQGHSTNSVNMHFPQQVPPEKLYHGTAQRFLESIRTNGMWRVRVITCICRPTSRRNWKLAGATASPSCWKFRLARCMSKAVSFSVLKTEFG